MDPIRRYTIKVNNRYSALDSEDSSFPRANEGSLMKNPPSIQRGSLPKKEKPIPARSNPRLLPLAKKTLPQQQPPQSVASSSNFCQRVRQRPSKHDKTPRPHYPLQNPQSPKSSYPHSPRLQFPPQHFYSPTSTYFQSYSPHPLYQPYKYASLCSFTSSQPASLRPFSSSSPRVRPQPMKVVSSESSHPPQSANQPLFEDDNSTSENNTHSRVTDRRGDTPRQKASNPIYPRVFEVGGEQTLVSDLKAIMNLLQKKFNYLGFTEIDGEQMLVPDLKVIKGLLLKNSACAQEMYDQIVALEDLYCAEYKMTSALWANFSNAHYCFGKNVRCRKKDL